MQEGNYQNIQVTVRSLVLFQFNLSISSSIYLSLCVIGTLLTPHCIGDSSINMTVAEIIINIYTFKVLHEKLIKILAR